MEIIGILILVVLIAGIAAILWTTRSLASSRSQEESPAAIALRQQLQQQVESLRTEVRDSILRITQLVGERLDNVTGQLQKQTESVGSRLDNATRVIGDVHRNLGELGKATEEIKDLGQSVAKLDELLRSPKLRGNLGEYLLEDLLKQVLPASSFEMQYRFKGGGVVDAVVRTSERLVPIDSKFPLETFRRLTGNPTEPEIKSLQRTFASDVRKHIDAIADKYILPDEGTFPFALMYIPAENVYYETIIRDEQSNGSGLYTYALQRKVIPVSPNSLFAYLQVIALGLRGLQIERRAREILAALQQLGGDIGKVRETFDTLGTHIENARKKYEDAGNRLTRFEGRLETIAERATQETGATSGDPEIPEGGAAPVAKFTN